MLSINMNKDIEQYQEPVAFGLNASQTISAIIAILVGVGITCLWRFVVGLSVEISIFLTLPFCVPIVIPALGKNHGLTVIEQLRCANKKKNVLAYAAMVPMEQKKRDKQRDERNKEKRGKKSRRKEIKGFKEKSISKNTK